MKRRRLTLGMLDAILTGLIELEASEGPQGTESEEESERIMLDAGRAIQWVHQELNRRAGKAANRKNNSPQVAGK